MLRALSTMFMLFCSNLASGAPSGAPVPSIVASELESGGTSFAGSQRARRPFKSASYPATRVGFCVGAEPACMGAGLHVDFTGESVGFKVGVGFLALNTSLRVYDEGTRLYVHGEALVMLFAYGFGGGIGWDIPLGKSQSLVLQPQIGVQAIYGFGELNHPEVLPSGSISVNWGTPR